MNRTRPPIYFETISDKKQKVANEAHTYSDTGVLLGFWFDERARRATEDESIKRKMAENQLGFQKLNRYIALLSRHIPLTRNHDGFVHHGDIVRFKCRHLESDRELFLAALPFNIAMDDTYDEPCLATATPDSRPMARTSFHVYRNSNNVPNHVPLMYDELVMVSTVDFTGQRWLHCEPRSFQAFARKSWHDEVKFVAEMCSKALWKVLPADINSHKWRRYECTYIPSNTNVVIRNVLTGQYLAMEVSSKLRTVLGHEKEVSGHSYEDRRRIIGPENIWQIEAPLMGPESYGEPICIPTNSC